MKNKTKKIIRMTIFNKVFLAFLIIIVPVYFFSIYINIRNLKNIENSIVEPMQSGIVSYLSSLENEFERLESLSNMYILDNDFQTVSNRYYTLGQYEKTDSINKIKNKLGMLSESSPYISNALAIFPQIDKIVTAISYGGVYDIDTNLFLDSDTTQMLSMIYDDIYIVNKFPNVPSKAEKNLILNIQISESKIKSDLKQLESTYSAELFILSDSGEWFIGSEIEDVLLTKIIGSIKSTRSENGDKPTVKNEGIEYFVIYSHSEALSSTIVLVTESDIIKQPLRQSKSVFILSIILVFGACFAITYWIHNTIDRPMKKLVGAFSMLEKGELNVYLQTKKSDEFSYIFKQFNNMVKRLNVLIFEVYEMELLNKKAQLKQFQSQIRPHFLFNSFLTLTFLAEDNKVDAVIKLTKYLEKYFRFITYNDNDDVSLGEDYDHAVTYSKIQSIRFAERIKLNSVKLDKNIQQIKVPRLIIQPILENAYNHGLNDKKKNGLINMGCREEDDKIIIRIEDNGEEVDNQKLTDMKESLLFEKNGSTEMKGMMNVHRRLVLKFGEDCGLRLSMSNLGGLCVDIAIKKEGGTNV